MGKQTNAILEKNLSANQKESARSIDCDVLVRAGAGSGKTKTLVARYLFLLDENRTWHPSDITAVTFTRKAAREMQSRIREQMMNLAVHSGDDIEERKYWLQMLNEMDSANIGTVHSLCGRILRTHPAEAGLDPAFSVLDDNRAALLIGQVVKETISRISADPDFETLLNLYNGNKLTSILSGMLKNRGKTDFALSVPGRKTEEILRKQAADFLLDPEYAGCIDEYRDMTNDPGFDDLDQYLSGRIRGLIAAYDKGVGMLETESHPADILKGVYSAFDDWGFNKGNKKLRANAKQFRDGMKAEFPFVEKDSDNPSRDIKWYKDFWKQCDEAEEILRNLWPVIRNDYMDLLDALQTIDFDAMESLTLDLLRTHQDIREEWNERVKALLVDEFQDTNDAQAELFSLLNPSRSRLFAVGDKKQSIYGFRGTNAALFERKRDEVKLSGGKDFLLDTTYRTEPELLLPMGRMLEQVMADAVLSERDFYAAYEPMKNPEIPSSKPDPLPKEQPCIELLLGDIQQKEDDPDKEIVGRMLAQRLTELMNAGLLRTWNDAVILCRSANDFKQFEKALEAWNIPYVTIAGKGYYDRPEVRDILNILRAAENPNDNAVLTGFLLSPSIGFSAEMTALLYRYANKGGLKMSFYQALTDDGFSFDDVEKQKILEHARSILDDLIHISGQVPLDEVLEEAFRLTGIRTMLALDSGDRAWLNLDKLIPVARESKLTSVSEFLDYLKEIEETGAREGEAPSDNNGAVRIMTIHQAKGLEFPVTILFDNEFSMPNQPAFVQNSEGTYVFYSSPAHPRFADAKKQESLKDKAEWLRLFYVAATRAEYRLIICGKKPENMDGKTDSWLKRALLPLPGECTEPGEYIGPAWGEDGQQVRIRCSTELPAVPFEDAKTPDAEIAISGDCSLLLPVTKTGKQRKRSPEHTAALTVGKLVHMGMELWRFPAENGIDPVLEDAFRRILLQTDNLDSGDQQSVLEKAEMLLGRFRDSKERLLIESAEKRWHEIPFSFTKRNYTVNGIIDLLMKDAKGYTVIDFKTDELKNLDDFTEAVKTHTPQLEEYRRALKTTMGVDPVCYICFLDYCGKVYLHPVGKDAAGPSDNWEEPDEWLPEEPDQDESCFDEKMKYSDCYPSEI